MLKESQQVYDPVNPKPDYKDKPVSFRRFNILNINHHQSKHHHF